VNSAQGVPAERGYDVAGRLSGEREHLGWGTSAHRPLAGTEPLTRVAARSDPHVVSVPEAAEMLGISKDLAYDLARRGELPGALQLGRRWRVSLIRLRAAAHGTHDGAPQHAG
jgi:excisionase family DNA binding protein